MSISSKSRYELHPQPQTWLGKLLNSDAYADTCDMRDEVLKCLATEDVMRTFLVSKRALTASDVTLKMRMDDLRSLGAGHSTTGLVLSILSLRLTRMRFLMSA